MNLAVKMRSIPVKSLAFVLSSFVVLITPRFSTAGTALGDLAASMQPGAWAELVTSNIGTALQAPGSGGVGHILPYADGMKWDPTSRKVYYMGSDDPGDGPRWVIYSEAANSWTVVPEQGNWWAGSGVMHQYNQLDLDPTAGVIYKLTPDGVKWYKYVISSGTWTQLPNTGVQTYSCCEALVYYPEMSSVLMLNAGDVRRYNVTTGQFSWLSTPSSYGTSYHSIAEYNPIHKVVIFGGGNATSQDFYKVNSAGQITTLRTPPIDLESPRTELTYDPVTGTYLVFRMGKTFYTYDVLTDTWSLQPNTNIPADIWNGEAQNHLHTLATPIATYGVVMFTTCKTGGSCKVYLYKHAPSTIDITPPAVPRNLRIN